MKKQKRNFRFRLKPEFIAGSCKDVVVESVSVKGALQKMRRFYNDVKQFELVR